MENVRRNKGQLKQLPAAMLPDTPAQETVVFPSAASLESPSDGPFPASTETHKDIDSARRGEKENTFSSICKLVFYFKFYFPPPWSYEKVKLFNAL